MTLVIFLPSDRTKTPRSQPGPRVFYDIKLFCILRKEAVSLILLVAGSSIETNLEHSAKRTSTDRFGSRESNRGQTRASSESNEVDIPGCRKLDRNPSSSIRGMQLRQSLPHPGRVIEVSLVRSSKALSLIFFTAGSSIEVKFKHPANARPNDRLRSRESN